MPKEEGPSSTKDKAGGTGGKPGLLASMLNPFRKQAKPEAVQGIMAAASSEEGPAHRQQEDEEDDEEEDDAEDEDEDEPVITVEGAYDPTEFDSLTVSTEIKEIFGFITRYTPQTVELDQELRPFVPELIPAVGDIDAFLKVPRPDGRADSVQLGLRVLDEPSAQQSDPSILALRLRALSRDARLATTSKAVVKSVDKPEEQNREIELWLQSVQELHRARPPPTVHYTRNMPDVESLMQEWPPDFEEMLAEVQVPTAELECSLEEYATMACLLMDIPVYKGKLIQSLHVLFTLFTAFKNSQHFGAMGMGTGGGTSGGGKAPVEDTDAEGVDRLVL
ncbi:intraflagellar transport 46 [Rhipicephalus microplus]|uniref:intraflagellar transport 46 n=1 Tax=Rhipicephalus microplus TaxID=6941 RepID=UPI003F6C9653